MSERMFPIQTQRDAAPHPLQIPWSIAALAYSKYAAEYGRGQTLERLAERGGFGPDEMDYYLPGWREQVSELTALRAECDRLRADEEMLNWLEESANGIAVLHDDEGAWIVANDGMQSIRSTLAPGEAWATTLIVIAEEFTGFRPSIREAIDAAMKGERT